MKEEVEEETGGGRWRSRTARQKIGGDRLSEQREKEKERERERERERGRERKIESYD